MSTESTPLKQLRTLADIPISEQEPMTQAQTELYIRIAMGKEKTEIMKGAALPAYDPFGISQPQQIAAICNRLAQFTPEIEYDFVTIFVCSIFCKAYGDCTQWAHTLAIETQKRGHAITLHDWSMIFALGIPSEASRREIWREQKLDDASEATRSIVRNILSSHHDQN